MTTAASGSSTKKNTQTAVSEAATAALGRLQTKPGYGFLFAGPNHSLGAALGFARVATDCTSIIGCTTAGEFDDNGLSHGGLVLLLVATDEWSCKGSFGSGLKARPEAIADDLARSERELREAALGRSRRCLTTVLLTDGLSGTAEKVVADLHDRHPASIQIVGGAAGDEGQFKATYVGLNAKADTDSVAALHLLTDRPWGVGVGHGLRPTTKPMRVTQAAGNVVHTLDGEPAFDAYKRHAAARGIILTIENAAPYLIGNELGIHFFEKVVRARAPLSAAADGSLTCAAEIPKGAMVSILDGEPAAMVDAARAAAEEARSRLGGDAAAVLLFDCVCRGMILKDAFQREIEAVSSVFRGAPVAGFLTYGEIARYGGKLDGWHNATAVVAAIPKGDT